MGALKLKSRSKGKPGGRTVKPSTFSQRLQTWMDANLNWILGGLIGVLILVGAVWGFRIHTDSRERHAQQEYTQLSQKWPAEEDADTDTEKYKQPIVDLETFVQRRDGTKAAARARLDLAQAYYRTQQYDNAVKAGMDALKEVSSDAQMSALARYQLALAYQALGKPDEAKAQWDVVKDKAFSGMEREIRWRQGMLYANRQEYPKAVEQYELALKANGSYPADSLIEAELANAKAKAGAGTAAESSNKGS